MTILFVVFSVLGIALVTIGIFWPGRSVVAVEAQPARRWPSFTNRRVAVINEPVALAIEAVESVPVLATITWPLAIDDTATDLDRVARLRLIESFTFVPSAWAAEVLQHAYHEERDELREAAVHAIAECGAVAEPVLAAAVISEHASERAVGVDGYAKIGVLDAVIPLLDDTSLPVAISAAYALARGGRSDVIDAHFAAETDAPRREEIRAVLSALA